MKPSKLEFDIAIAWLQVNEGEIEEHTACNKVAQFLIDYVENQSIKQIAKEAGVSVTKLRKRIKENRKISE